VAPALKKLGWSMKVYQYSVSAGPQNMAADIGSALQASPDYLGISAIYPLPTYLTELAAAKSKNVPVASLAGANSSSFIGCFSCDAATDQEGVLTAATAISDSRGKGNTLIVTDPTIVPLQQIVTGIKQEFARADPSAPLNVLDVSLLQAPAQNSSTVISYLQAHPQVRYVIFPAPPVYTGLFPQLKSAGLLSHLTTIAAAISPADLPLIKSGELSAGVAAETDINTWRMVDAFVHEAVHEPLPAKFADPAGWARIITKSDATPSSLDPTNWRQTFYSAWKVG
jgi:ABC-type sugar transport system substrate-binding protein